MYKVVLVDDEKIIRIGMQTIINWEELGFEVVGIASDGEQALKLIEENGADVVITDIKMPNMDGLTLVKKLKEQKFDGEIVMLTNYGEFELARDALRQGVHDYLLKATLRPEELVKSITEIKQKLEETKQNLNHKVSKKPLAQFREEEIEKIRKIFEETIEGKGVIGAEEFEETYRFLLVKRVRSKYEKQDKEIKALEAYRHSVNNIVKEIISSDKAVYDCFYKDWMLVLLSSKQVSEDEMKKVGLQIQNHIKMYTNVKVISVRGKAFNKKEEFEKFLKQCTKATGHVFFIGYQRIILQEEYNENKNYLEFPQEKYISELKCAVEKGGYDEAIEVQEKWFETIKEIRWSEQQVDQFLNRLMNEMIVDYGIYLDKDKDKLKDIVVKYRQCTTMDEVREVLGELTYTLCNYILHRRSTHYRREVLEIIDYINGNITKKITLASLAEEINMNESYISRLFKSETGTNLINYINMIKMERAKELLRQPDMIVKDVANALGFEEQSYFNRMFKKYFGLNPKEYKKQV